MEYYLHPIQPIETDIHLSEGVFVKKWKMAVRGMIVPQHSHSYDHVSVIVKGTVRIFGQHAMVLRAPASVLIKAGIKHTFETLTDDVIILCVHDREVAILEEHQLVEGV